jgi:antitoxin (DNA-binding transcriptional repressor) of toxin-antitoxin stability system
MPKISLDNARVVTARELANHSGRILKELNDAGQNALITKHGRYIALIQPLADAQVETISLHSLALAGLDDDDTESVDPAAVRRRLDARRPDGN